MLKILAPKPRAFNKTSGEVWINRQGNILITSNFFFKKDKRVYPVASVCRIVIKSWTEDLSFLQKIFLWIAGFCGFVLSLFLEVPWVGMDEKMKYIFFFDQNGNKLTQLPCDRYSKEALLFFRTQLQIHTPHIQLIRRDTD